VTGDTGAGDAATGGTGTGDPGRRRDELAANLRAVRSRIERACAAAGRDPAGVTLLAVTKTWPDSDVRLLAELGLRDFGENREQDLAAKAVQTADLALRWHFVGRLQANKARGVGAAAAVVHSVDREKLLAALGAGARAGGRVLDVYVQVSLDSDPGRGGARPGDVPVLADAVAVADGLRLVGVMTVPPLGADPLTAYRTAAVIAADVRAAHPAATGFSAGMSADLDAAIAAGSTVVRVGTALLGGRPPIVG
jgi:pyridoxal phosphate enzyme (YggS family)